MKTDLSRAAAAVASVAVTFALLQGVVSLAEPASGTAPTLMAHAAPVCVVGAVAAQE